MASQLSLQPLNQLSGTQAFHSNETSINSPYVDGVSVTHGSRSDTTVVDLIALFVERSVTFKKPVLHKQHSLLRKECFYNALMVLIPCIAKRLYITLIAFLGHTSCNLHTSAV